MTRTLMRRWKSRIVLACSAIAALLGLVMLLWILYEITARGLAAWNKDFFTQLPAPPGMPGGGLANAILGTLLMTMAATVMAVPLGLWAGAYLAEFGKESRPAAVVRFVSDLLVSAPSIVIGVFVYLILVRPRGHFSGWAGSVSLALIMLPVVTRTTEEMLRLVPTTLREAALALGAPYWHVMWKVVRPAAAGGLLTGIMLAIARVAGETAPLLFTALNSPFWPRGLDEPTANLTVTLFNYAMSPYDDWHTQAWGAALLITTGVLGITLFTRFFVKRRKV